MQDEHGEDSTPTTPPKPSAIKAIFVIGCAIFGAYVGSRYGMNHSDALQQWMPTILGACVGAGVASFIWGAVED